MHISKNIRYLRTKGGHTKKWLSDELQKTSSAVADYEKGRATPPVDVLLKLCAIYDVTLDELVVQDLEAQSYQPQSSSGSDNSNRIQGTKNETLLNKLLAMKILEVAETIKKKDPKEYERLHLASLSKTVQDIIDEE